MTQKKKSAPKKVSGPAPATKGRARATAEDGPARPPATDGGARGRDARARRSRSTRRRSSRSCSTSASCARSATTSSCCPAAPTGRSTRSPTAISAGLKQRGAAADRRRGRAHRAVGAARLRRLRRPRVPARRARALRPRGPVERRAAGPARRPGRRADRGRRVLRRRVVKVFLGVVGRLKESYFARPRPSTASGCGRTARSTVHEAKDEAALLAALPAERPPLRVRRARRRR